MRLESHPLAEMVPPMTEAEYAALREDIREHGLLIPIVLLDDQVLDGRHRARVCEELGITPATQEFGDGDPVDFVIATNLHRRHLTPGQLAVAAEALLDYEREEAKRRQREHGSTAPGRSAEANTSHQPVLSDRHSHANKAVARAGAKVGVSASTVERVQRVKARSPELHEQIRRGEITPSEAERKVTEQPVRPEPQSEHANWDRSTERFQKVAAKTVERAWKGVNALSVVCPSLAEMDTALIVETVSREDFEQMTREVSEAASYLRRFLANLKQEG